MKLTLDWNCVIEVEENRPQAGNVNELIEGHRRGEIEVALLAASASENTKSMRFPGNSGVFKQRIEQLGWEDLPLVKMPGVLGLSYYGYCFMVGDGVAFQSDLDALWQVIAPKVPRNAEDNLRDGQAWDDWAIQSEELAKWRNSWCDVISAYSHIHEERDVFVTNNTRDFHNNAQALASLGMKHISKPAETLELIDELRGERRTKSDLLRSGATGMMRL
jgi:HPt (histidine-containing phosphotransfer) domain-containing protein